MSLKWRAIIFGSMLSFAAAVSADARGIAFSIKEVIKDGDFIPHIPYESQVLGTYGPGRLVKSRDGIVRLYHSKSENLWLEVTSDPDSSAEHRGIISLLLSRIAPGPEAVEPKRTIAAGELYGIALGSDYKKVEARFPKVRPAAGSLGSRSAKVYRANPVPGESDVYVSYYVVDGKVAAYSIGVTE